MNKIPFVDLHAQYLGIRENIDHAIEEVISQSAFIGGAGNPFVKSFENNFAGYLGIKEVVSCANGTDSLEILLKAYGIGTGDEVIVPAMTWISTAEAVSSVGAKPVFADIEPEYYTIDPLKIEAALTANTRVIIVVHLYGQPADMEPVMAIAAKYNLVIIEDCAQAHGALYRDKMVGTLGHSASFSFYPGKNLGAYGDAGCIATNDSEIAQKCRMIANHGQAGKHQHLIEGRNSRMDGIQAAILHVKLPFLEAWTAQRIEKAGKYAHAIINENMVVPPVRKNCRHVFHLYVIQTPSRELLITTLKDNNIDAAVHYPVALPFLPCYAYQQKTISDYPVAAAFQERIVSIPVYPELTDEQILRVTEILNKHIEKP